MPLLTLKVLRTPSYRTHELSKDLFLTTLRRDNKPYNNSCSIPLEGQMRFTFPQKQNDGMYFRTKIPALSLLSTCRLSLDPWVPVGTEKIVSRDLGR